MSAELEIKSVNDGINAFDKAIGNLIRRKITFDKTAFVADMQVLYEQTLAKWQNAWNEMGLSEYGDIGRCAAISCGELTAAYCCNNLGMSRVNTEALVLLYNTLCYYIKARADSEKGIEDNVQRAIMKDMRFCGITDTEVTEIYDLIVYSDYCKWFELYDIDGYNVCDSFLHYLCGINKCCFYPEWYMQPNGHIGSKRSPILTDIRFLWYYAPKDMDLYVYKAENYCFKQMLRLSDKIIKKNNVSDAAVQRALMYLGVSGKILGRYADIACSGAPQRYTGILRDAIIAQSKKTQSFYQMFYAEKLFPRTKAYLGALVNHLQIVPSMRIFGLTDKYLAFAAPKGTDLSKILADDILADISTVYRIEDVKEFYTALITDV